MHAYVVCPLSPASRPAGLRDLFLLLSKLWLYALCLGLSARAKEGVVSLPSECSACCRNSRPPLVKTTNLPFSEIG